MDYEKKYKEKLERAQKVLLDCTPEERKVVEYIFPNLAESEDEKIRKWLIRLINTAGYRELESDKMPCSRTNVIAWLEKQGEQKPEVKYVYTKFRIGDVIVEIKPNGYCQPVRVKYVGEESYSCESDDGKRYLSFPVTSQDEYKLVEQKPTEWTAEDKNKVSILKTIVYDDCNAEDASRLITWLNDIEDRVMPQPKQEWSEEDEKKIDSIIETIRISKFEHPQLAPVYKGDIDWLKSLRGRFTWKPSEEQMRVLDLAIRCGINRGTTEETTLVSLFNNLKKLKG